MVFEEQILNSKWVSEQLKMIDEKPPIFSSKEEAVRLFSQELNRIAEQRQLSVEKLLEFASASTENHEDFDRALRLSSIIYSLKK